MTTLTLLIGAAGSGKSTYAAKYWRPDQIVSSDQLRGMLSGNPNEQDVNHDVSAILHRIVRVRLGRGLDTVVDATNADPDHRYQLLTTDRGAGAVAVAVVMPTPLLLCLAHNSGRPGPAPGQRYGPRVPDEVVTRQFKQIQASLSGLKAEGFNLVCVTAGSDSAEVLDR